MTKQLPIVKGIWPTMITPFTDDNKIDYPALEAMIEWYLARKVHGLFAVCQSSEMQYLSLDERTELAKFVVEAVNGRIPVAASGHNSSNLADQIDELKAMADTGIDVLVLVANRLAAETESEAVWLRNLEELMANLPDLPLGLYECPAPYNRPVEGELLKWCSETGRFHFFKDTSCDPDKIKAKIALVRGTDLKFLNANSATLLMSLEMGADGFSGVMGNFHPSLYVWLYENWQQYPEQAKRLQDFLGLASVIEQQCYPINAKYHCQLEGLPVKLYSRRRPLAEFKPSFKVEVEQLHALTQDYLENYRV